MCVFCYYFLIFPSVDITYWFSPMEINVWLPWHNSLPRGLLNFPFPHLPSVVMPQFLAISVFSAFLIKIM